MKIENVASKNPALPAGNDNNRPLKKRSDGSETVDNLPMSLDVRASRLAMRPQRLEKDRDVVKLSFQYYGSSQGIPSESCSYPGMNSRSFHVYYSIDPAFREAYMAYTVFGRQHTTGVFVDILV